MCKNGKTMGIRDEVQKRIDRKRLEIVDLEARIRETKIYIQALEDTLRILPREGTEQNIASLGELRVGSRVAKARDFLRDAGEPKHVQDILKGIGESTTPQNRAGLSSSLGAYVRENKIFTRPSPNTFGLVEFPPRIGTPQQGPPPGFGKDDEAPVDLLDG